MELTDRGRLHVTHCNTSLGLPKANAPAVPSVFRSTPPGFIGVQLTEGMMIESEASVSAIGFHHPDCACFTADEGESGAAA